jgi:hypothetical protein
MHVAGMCRVRADGTRSLQHGSYLLILRLSLETIRRRCQRGCSSSLRRGRRKGIAAGLHVADWIICASRLPQCMRNQDETTNKLQMTNYLRLQHFHLLPCFIVVESSHQCHGENGHIETCIYSFWTLDPATLTPRLSSERLSRSLQTPHVTFSCRVNSRSQIHIQA